jgi:hypothetical protein
VTVATAICRRASSPAEPLPAARRLRRILPALAGLLFALPAAGRELALHVERIEHPAFILQGVGIRLDTTAGSAELHIGRAQVEGVEMHDLRLRCAQFRLSAAELSCHGGRLDTPLLPAGADVALQADPANRTGTAHLRFSRGEGVALSAQASGALVARLQELDIARLRPLLPALASWQPGGRLSGEISHTPGVRGEAVRLDLRLKDGLFSSADGLQAAEGLGARLQASARRDHGVWRWRGSVDWEAGEAYLHPLYLTAGPVLQAAGSYRAGLLEVVQATLALDGVRSVAANAVVDVEAGVLREVGLSVADADLAVIGPQFLAPLVAPVQAERLRFAGHVSAGLRIVDGGLAALDAAFAEAGVSLDGQSLNFGPVSGAVPWRADAPTQARLTVAGGRWQGLQLGSFDVDAVLHGSRLAVPRLRIPLLDGAVVFENLALQRAVAGWSGEGGVVVEPLSVPLLTGALGLPEMAGVLSAALPGLRVSPGEVVLDGTLVVSVFDGYLRVSELRVLEPFGVASHLYADVDARHIDLAQLTDTFSFGGMSGYVDASVSGLELVRWRPVRFDARVASSPGRYPRRISQRAVQNISALGGAGAVAAIQRGVLSFFDSFGYREIGLSCVLADGVCLMGGLGEAGAGGFLLVRGGGIPALNVIGYNRRVDWQELVDRLQGVIESNASPFIR